MQTFADAREVIPKWASAYIKISFNSFIIYCMNFFLFYF